MMYGILSGRKRTSTNSTSKRSSFTKCMHVCSLIYCVSFLFHYGQCLDQPLAKTGKVKYFLQPRGGVKIDSYIRWYITIFTTRRVVIGRLRKITDNDVFVSEISGTSGVVWKHWTMKKNNHSTLRNRKKSYIYIYTYIELMFSDLC